jgi:NADPH-dependent curcumin reductase CurA
MRGWIADAGNYSAPVPVGSVMRALAVGDITESRAEGWTVGETLCGWFGWQDEAVVAPGAVLRRVTESDLSPSLALGVLGINGVTAYLALTGIGQPKAGECVVVSAAAGAVGSIVGQIAKLKGCRVVGIAGGAEKCRWLVDDLGFDGAIDYKSQDVAAELDRLCPEGIDVSFENVGGAVMEAVFNRLNRDGRMALCGLISAYNQEGPMAGPTDFGRILMNRLTIRGFIVLDFLPQARRALTDLGTWVAEGRLKWKVDVVQGIENAPAALDRLFSGANDGKLLVQLAADADR